MRERFIDIAALAARTNKAAVLVVQQFPIEENSGPRFPPVRESIANLMAFVELGTAADFAAVLDEAQSFNWIAVDCDHKLAESASIVAEARARVDRARLLFYSDNQVWFQSAFDMVQRIEHGLSGKAVAICGSGPIGDALAAALTQVGATIRRPAPGAEQLDLNIVLGTAQKRLSIDLGLIERLPANASIYDLGLGTLSVDAANRARARGCRLYRLDNRAGISSAIIGLLETDSMIATLMGHATLRGIEVVAGGLLGAPGAVVVDDIRRPRIIFGVADGTGRFRPEPLCAEDREHVEFVRALIMEARSGASA
jgi:hypothetical protein